MRASQGPLRSIRGASGGVLGGPGGVLGGPGGGSSEGSWGGLGGFAKAHLVKKLVFQKHTKNHCVSMMFEGFGVSQKGLGRVFGGSWGWFRGLWVGLVRLGGSWGGA